MTLNILLLCNKPNAGQDANTIVDHLDSFLHYSKHNIWLCSNLGNLPNTLQLNKFDVIVIHYSLSLLNDHYLSKTAKLRLSQYTGLKVVFIQDEYRQINKMIAELAFLNVDVLFTCFPEPEINNIYTEEKLPNLSKYNNLTGYTPQRLLDLPEKSPIATRPIHVGYRGRKLPFWYGELAYEKSDIIDKWLLHTVGSNLKTDVSYHDRDRIYGAKWTAFLSSCKTTLGVESGASVMDFTGELEREIDLHQLMYPHDSFHLVQKKYLQAHEGKYTLNQISPRCFEAIALKTVLVLYEGEYSGILVPGRHYISLKKDFSNIKEVLACIQDDSYLQNMADVAYQEIALNPKYGYRCFIESVDRIITNEFTARTKPRAQNPYQKHEFEQAITDLPLKSRLYKKGFVVYQRLPANLRLLVRGLFKPQELRKQLTRIFFGLLQRASKKKRGESKNET